MKLTREEYRALERLWYNKLANSGFKDIEKVIDDELVLVKTASYCYRKHRDEFSRQMKEEYFRQVGLRAHDEETLFKNDIHRYILIRHSEGAEIKTIVAELKLRGSDRDRSSVRFIIRKYEMAWGFRNYDPQQLGIKKSYG